MIEGDVLVYNCFKEGILKGTYNLAAGGHVFHMSLHKAEYEPDIDVHATRSDIIASEYPGAGGSGYTAGGMILGSQSVYTDITKDAAIFDANDLTWSGLQLGPGPDATPGWAILWDDTVGETVPVPPPPEPLPIDPLVAVWKLGSTNTTGGNYTLAWSPNGIIVLA